MPNIDFTFPFSIKNGSLTVVGNDQKLVEQQILSVILTKRGERVMRNNYGTGELLFNSSVNLPDITEAIYSSVTLITNVRIQGNTNEDGVTNLEIFYNLKDNPSEFYFFAQV
ncbi:MAG: hypothetical protein ACRDBG_21550 [Waterburya sp.]